MYNKRAIEHAMFVLCMDCSVLDMSNIRNVIFLKINLQITFSVIIKHASISF
jgi:hypothetical protein